MVTGMITGKVIGLNQEGVKVAIQRDAGVIAAEVMFGYPVAGEINFSPFQIYRPA